MIRKLSSVYVLAHSGLLRRYCPVVDSQLTLELLLLHIRGGCSLTVLLFSLMLMRACCFIPCLLASAYCILRTALYIDTEIHKLHNFLSGRNANLGPVRRNLSYVNASGYIFPLTFRSLSDIAYSDKCRTKKSYQYVKRMLPLFAL